MYRCSAVPPRDPTTDVSSLDVRNSSLRDEVEAELVRGRVGPAIRLSLERVALSSCSLLHPHPLHTVGRLALTHYYWARWGNRGQTYRNIRLPVFY